MKNRKNQPQSSPNSASALGDPSRILFYSDGVEGRLAQLLFDPEARKMEVYWIAFSVCTNSTPINLEEVKSYTEALQKLGDEFQGDIAQAPRPVADDDLQLVKMVVLVQLTKSADVAKAFLDTYPSFKGEKEVWKISSGDDVVGSLYQHVKNLLVRLILKGGKRAPVPQPVASVKPQSIQSGGQSAVRVRLESKGRGGKKVTVVFGLEMEPDEMESLATELKQMCGTGGTVKDDTIEIQGDQCQRVLSELQRRGMKAKRSGG